jgi:outer membrane protease
MKRIFGFAFFISICCTGVFPVLSYGQNTRGLAADNSPYRISFAAGAGILRGQAEEIVYKKSDTDEYLSQLLWDLMPQTYVGSALSLFRADPLAGMGGAADISVKFGIPMASGAMEDRDWIGSDKLTNFSAHDAVTQNVLLLDILGGITIPVAHAATINVMASFSYMHFSWTARDGYRKYEREDWEKIAMPGDHVTYDQQWILVAPGLGVSLPVHRMLSFDFRFCISPLVFAWDEDIHITAKKTYNDYMQGGLYLEPVLEVSFSPSQYVTLSAQGSWRYITGARGDNEVTSKADTTVSSNQVGAAYSAFDGGLFLKFTSPKR